jgi:orotidine-5'-phosphate decarboxylase
MVDRKKSRVIVALDYPDTRPALELVGRLDPHDCRLKVGKELFTCAGPEFVETLTGRGFDVFLDLKFHDIPSTVAKACLAAARLGVWMMNVHALGGMRMLEAARDAIDHADHKPLLIAVTLLTSLDQSDLDSIGLTGSPEDNVLRLATLAKHCALDGVVCSSHETALLRERLGRAFTLVTPGIRPAASQADDQRRIMTPVDAIRSGASYLVIGRPVTQADDPVGILRSINSELAVLS